MINTSTWERPGGRAPLKLLKCCGRLVPPPALPDPPEPLQVREPEPDTEPLSAEEVDRAELR